MTKCGSCGGSGLAKDFCFRCHKTGRLNNGQTRCSQCKGTGFLPCPECDGGGVLDPSAPPKPLLRDDSERQSHTSKAIWYYKHGEKPYQKAVGPMGDTDLHKAVRLGQLAPQTMVYCEGLGDWTPYSEVFNIHVRASDAPPTAESRQEQLKITPTTPAALQKEIPIDNTTTTPMEKNYFCPRCGFLDRLGIYHKEVPDQTVGPFMVGHLGNNPDMPLVGINLGGSRKRRAMFCEKCGEEVRLTAEYDERISKEVNAELRRQLVLYGLVVPALFFIGWFILKWLLKLLGVIGEYR